MSSAAKARHQAREQIAYQMSDMNNTSADWTHIEPLLDEAMQSLDDSDRTAILLRCFENKSLREVGEAIGASEDATQKRVGRAVERLGEFFCKRKVIVGAGGLLALLSANAIQAAPATCRNRCRRRGRGLNRSFHFSRSCHHQNYCYNYHPKNNHCRGRRRSRNG